MARCCTVLSAVSTDRLAALRACWHPVAYADVITAPHATTLLGEPLVLWRDARGAVHAFRDVCVHRGTALSLGRVDGNEIVCAYHGWRYGADGACTAIPQLAEPTRVPARARGRVCRVRAIRHRLGRACRAGVADPRRAGAGECRLARRANRSVRLGVRRLAAGRELHRLRPLRVRASGAARRSCAAGGRAIRSHNVRPAAALRARAAGHGQRDHGRRAHRRDATYAVCAAPALHDRRAHRLGRPRGSRIPLRLPAGRRRSLHRLLPGRAQLQPRAARPRHPGIRADDFRAGPACGRVAAARSRAVRSRRGASPDLRRGRRRVPARNAGERLRVIFAAFRVKSFRFQWPADLLTSWAFEMETLTLGWYVMTQTGSVLMLTVFGSLQFLGTLAAPGFGVLADRLGAGAMLAALRASYAALATVLMALAMAELVTPVWVRAR